VISGIAEFLQTYTYSPRRRKSKQASMKEAGLPGKTPKKKAEQAEQPRRHENKETVIKEQRKNYLLCFAKVREPKKTPHIPDSEREGRKEKEVMHINRENAERK